MALSRLCAVVGVLVCLTTRAQSLPSLCESPVVTKRMRGECVTYSVPYRDNNQITQVDAATVDVGWETGSDTVWPIQHSYIRLPDGEIRRLRSIPPFPFVLDQALGFNLETLDRALVFEYQALEHIGRRICSVGVAKYPFEGRIEYCEGQSKPKGMIGLLAGIMSPKEARGILCSHMQTSGCRGLGRVELAHNDESQLVYRAEARIILSELPRESIDLQDKRPYRRFAPIQYEQRFYEVTLNGIVNLRSRSAIVCDRDCNQLDLQGPTSGTPLSDPVE
jgi:hypothetical protein